MFRVARLKYFKNDLVKGLSRGFNLIEIMVVVTLIGLLVAFSTVYLMGRLEEGKINTARAQAYEIAKSLELYRLQIGNYPTTSEGLETLANPPHGQPIMQKVPNDPWGREYHYANPGIKNPNGVDVWSNGKSGEEDSETDIGNWQPE